LSIKEKFSPGEFIDFISRKEIRKILSSLYEGKKNFSEIREIY
jgi:DNA-binding HxlR family transcriptional regulator